MKIQCRTCHAITESERTLSDWPITFFGYEACVYAVPCGHGNYIGKRFLLTSTYSDPHIAPPPWEWTWWDTEALVQRKARQKYDCTRPKVEAWDPPPLSFICVCGSPISATGFVEDENDECIPFEGWEGICECGVIVRVTDGGEIEKTYRQLREDRHQEAMALWEALRPPAPKPLAVAGLFEAESED